MNYPNVQLSRGNLTGSDSPTIASPAARTVHFAWNDNSFIGNASASDLAHLIVYFPSEKEAVYALNTMPRNIGSIDLTMPAKYSSKLAHCWMTFQSADGKEIANSTYAGSVTVM